ncbi:MAG: ABC transporter ATP-binding protein [Tepidisphaerales bacterium]
MSVLSLLPRRRRERVDVRVLARKAQPLPESTDGEEAYRPIEWPLIRRCLGLLYPYRYRYALGIGVCTVHVLLEMAGPQFIGHLVDFCAKAATVAADSDSVFYYGVEHVVWTVAFWAVVITASILLQRWVILIMTDAGERVQFDIRRRLFAHLQTLSMSYFDRNKLGRIISRNTSDVESLREVNVWGLNRFVQNTLMIAVSGAALAYTDWRLFLAVAWLGPVIFWSNAVFRRKMGRTQQEIREGWTRVSANLAENITGMRVVTAFNRQVPNLGTFNLLQEANTLNNIKGARLNGIYQPTLELMRFFGRIIIFTFGAYLVVTGNISVGTVVMAFLYWDWFMNPILDFGNFSNQLMAAMAGGERVFALLDTKPEVTDVPDAYPLPPIRGHVRFENVTFGYNPERPVLHDIDFEAQPGQMVALVGHTGSGKSSTISLIARFYQPQKGRVLIDGHDIRYVTGDSLHRQIGLVLQVNYLFTGTVLDNIRYGRPDATDEQIIEAAKALGTHETIAALQNGYHTQVGERGASLSLGQRQLICFTRAFLADPRIFMLDEATSSVDTATEQLLQASLERLLQGRTTFIVAHRLSTIMKADQILVFDQGRIIERGTHRELLLRGGKYAHLYEQFVQAVE